MASFLIVDDDATMREALAEVLEDLGHATHTASDGQGAIELLAAQRIDAMLLDLRMPGLDGLDVLRRVGAMREAPVVTVLTAHATADNTIEAIRLGAFDHLTKPISRQALTELVTRMLASPSRSRPPQATAETGSLIGSSEAIRAVQKAIGMLADSEVTALITGETGTGKEVVARAIHDHGRRGDRQFVAVNCAAIPGDLLESELFGHARGSFTGASQDRAGAFLQAAGGTLFLDEIGDMDLAMQAKILRALQERVVIPVGGKPVAVDVRVIAATHRDLRQLVRLGGFREDLYYRLHVVPIHLPPLSERSEDVLPLAEHFLQRCAPGKTLSKDAAAQLTRHSWPGNVRELKNAMERAAVMVRGTVIQADDLAFLAEQAPPPDTDIDWPDEDLPSALARLEETLIRRALRITRNNRTEAAKRLNVNRQLLYAKMKRFGIDSPED